MITAIGGRGRISLLRMVRAEQGVALIEFAVVAPVLVTMVLGVLDFGLGFWFQQQVNAAADAGAAYAVSQGFNSTSIENAIESGGPTAIQASPAPTEVCGCPNATSGIVTSSPATPPCSGTCSDGSTPGIYVTVNAQLSYTTIFPWPGIARPMTISSSQTVRIQ
jgi:Flp pilus assembly protein TadG